MSLIFKNCLPYFLLLVLLVPTFGQAKVKEKFDPTFDTQIKWLGNALSNSNVSTEKIDTFRNYNTGKNSYHVSAANAPWAGYWWPWRTGGISLRWQQESPIYPEPKVQKPGKAGQNETPLDPHVYYPTLDKMISADEMVAKLKELETSGKLRQLSPVEKFDIYVGDYHFSATKHSKEKRGPTTKQWDIFAAGWRGYCNGARAAGALLPEPTQPLTVTNPDGIKVTFDIADLKALGTSAYFYTEKWSALGLPTRGSITTFVVDGNQKPPNMGVFDIAIRAYLADSGKLFFMDKSASFVVSNVTVIGFQREIKDTKLKLSKSEYKNHPGAYKRISIDTTLEYLGEIEKRNDNKLEFSGYGPIIRESNAPTKQLVAQGVYSHKTKVSYYLYVDANDRIIDGELDGRGPDMYWFAAGQGIDDRYYEPIIEAYP
ncbi:MAG: hypothetical protein WCG27_04685, partial [Pseudomonadota bacterium]